jgi:hypothetical protein
MIDANFPETSGRFLTASTNNQESRIMFKGILAAVALAVSCAAHAATTSTIELISRATQTATASANGSSLGPVYSPDGTWVLFSSTAPDLVNLPGNANFQLFAVNTTNGAVQLVSSSAAGGLGNSGSYAGGMSADGRYVAFQSSASNLSPADTNFGSDIFLRDLTAGTTTLVSKDVSGSAAGSDVSDLPEISSDGGTVVFLSYATNLVTGDTNSMRDLFAWKRSDGSMQLVSVGLNGKSVTSESTDFSLSADGRFVLFTAGGTNLTIPNRGGGSDVYLRDLQNGTTRWVSAPLTNLAGFSSNSAGSAMISADGRYVVMVAAPPAPAKPALVRVDLNDDSVVVITNNVLAQTTYASWFGPAMSDDGQFAAYSNGTNVFYWSAASGQVTRVDVTASGAAPDGLSDNPRLSHDGKTVTFLSTSSDLVAGVGNGESQIYARDMVTGVTRLISHSTAGAATIGNDISTIDFHANDGAIVFDSRAGDLTAMDNNDDYDVFSWNVATGDISLLSQSKATAPSLTADGSSNFGRYAISADGRFIAISSLARLSANDTNSTYDAYVYDRVGKTNILVSAGPDGFSKNGSMSMPMISGNGKKVVFESNSTGLAGPEDTRTGTSVYVRDLEAGTLLNISGTNVENFSARRISDDGRFVFLTTSTRLHRYDLLNRTNELMGVANTPAYTAFFSSGDGSRAAYTIQLSNYLHDFTTGARVVVSSTAALLGLTPQGEVIYSKTNAIVVTNSVTGQMSTYGPIPAPQSVSISGDGTIIAYQVRTVVGGRWEVWYLDRATGQTNLVSKALGSSSNGNGDSGAPSVSADGRFIAFESWAMDLVSGDSNGIKDVFVFDRTTGEISLVSHAGDSSAPGNSGSFNPLFAPSGTLLVFISASSDMVSGDLNDDVDVFATTIEGGAAGSDSDGDGLDDDWERATFSTLAHGANDDTDGDGATNRQEFLAGTNANNSSSSLEVQSIEVANDGSARLTFSSVQGKRYRVEFTTSLAAGAQWTTVGGEVTGGATGETTVNIPSAGEGYYRLRLAE